MKKVLISFLSLIVLTGCSCSPSKLVDSTPTEVVERYFSNYQTLSSDVLTQLEDTMDEAFTDTQRDDYRDFMKKHYKDLNYEIKDEIIDGDKATVVTEIEVYDYSKVLKESDAYLNEHPEEFNDDKGNYDISLFNDYRINKLKDVNDKVTYTLNLTLTKTNDKWILDDISDVDESKIHGTYVS